MHITHPPLKSVAAYWDPANTTLTTLLAQPPEGLSKESLVTVVRELDRRFMQLWDKVGFERDQGLVGYSKLTHEGGVPCETAEAQFKAAYIIQFLSSYMAFRYDADCSTGHPGEPYRHQPVEDAAFLAECAWAQVVAQAHTGSALFSLGISKE